MLQSVVYIVLLKYLSRWDACWMCPASNATALLDAFLTEAVPTNQHLQQGTTLINGLRVINKSPTAGVYMKSFTSSPQPITKLNC